MQTQTIAAGLCLRLQGRQRLRNIAAYKEQWSKSGMGFGEGRRVHQLGVSPGGRGHTGYPVNQSIY